MRKLQLKTVRVAAALLLLGACGSETDQGEPAEATDVHALSQSPRLAAEYWRAYLTTPASVHPARRQDVCTVAMSSTHQVLLGGAVATTSPLLPQVAGQLTRTCALDHRPVLLPIATAEADARFYSTRMRPAEMVKWVRSFVSGVVSYEVSLDDRRMIPVLEMRTGPQPFSVPARPWTKWSGGASSVAFADGLFVELPTLPAGDHRLEVRVRMRDPRDDSYVIYALHR